MNVLPTRFEGMFLIELDLFDDIRGSFREAWQREKMEKLGLPAFQPVQLNFSVTNKGAIRGIHAEPWEKLCHVAHGKAFVAIVDLRRDQPTFGTHQAFELDRANALFLPRGMGNSFQALTDPAVYTYLVSGHWQPGVAYPAIAYDDPDLGIDWPIKGDAQILSEKDRSNKRLKDLSF